MIRSIQNVNETDTTIFFLLQFQLTENNYFVYAASEITDYEKTTSPIKNFGSVHLQELALHFHTNLQTLYFSRQGEWLLKILPGKDCLMMHCLSVFGHLS